MKLTYNLLVYILISTNIIAQNNTSKIDSLENLLKESKSEKKVDLLNQLYVLTSRSNPQKADEYVRESVSLSVKLNYQLGLALGLNYSGNSFLQHGYIDSAQIQFTSSLNIFRQLGMAEEEAKVLNNLGISFDKIGEYNKALKYFLMSYELYEQLGITSGLASVCNNLGAVYYLLGQPNKALDFFKASMNARDDKDLFANKQSLANIAAIYFERWELDSAKFYYLECIKIEKALSDQAGLGKTYNSLASISLEQGDMDKAYEYLNKGLNYAEKSGDIKNLLSLNNNLALYYRQLKKFNKAIDLLKDNEIKASELGFKEELKNTYQYLTETYALNNDFYKAYYALKQYEELKSDLFIEQGLIAETETLFIKQRQENEILKLEREREKRKSQIILIIAISLILVLALVFLLVYSKMKQKANLNETLAEQQKIQFQLVLETQEKERKRIAADLHDSVGQILAMTKLSTSELIDQLAINDEEHKKQSEKLLVYIDDACNEVRAISHALMPGSLIRLGLVSAVKDLIRKFTTAKLKITFDASDISFRVREAVEITYYRIIQELLNNVVKHAQATEVNIRLFTDKQMISLEMKDNGIGLEENQIKGNAGIGWKNIKSRIELLNGNIHLNSSFKKGTRLRFNIPL